MAPRDVVAYGIRPINHVVRLLDLKGTVHQKSQVEYHEPDHLYSVALPNSGYCQPDLKDEGEYVDC